jgi:CheY-like chemotaxis protein
MKKAYGTYEIAKFCHVMPTTIGRWIEEGKLPSFTTGGGHRRVLTGDLIAFLKAHNFPISSILSDAAALRILVVEDNKMQRRFVQKTLRAHFGDVQIDEAVDGFEAGHKLALGTPNLVLLDLYLPGVNGLKVCQTICQNETLKKTKILAMSGQNPEISRRESLKAGAHDFISKPFESKDFVTKIAQLVGLPIPLNILNQ